jgi:hypothetical protein
MLRWGFGGLLGLLNIAAGHAEESERIKLAPFVVRPGVECAEFCHVHVITLLACFNRHVVTGASYGESRVNAPGDMHPSIHALRRGLAVVGLGFMVDDPDVALPDYG